MAKSEKYTNQSLYILPAQLQFQGAEFSLKGKNTQGISQRQGKKESSTWNTKPTGMKYKVQLIFYIVKVLLFKSICLL